MVLRKKIFPRILIDQATTCFLALMIPLTYWFEISIILPFFYEQWSFWYNCHFISGTFLFINVTSSFAGVILIDTSIKHVMIPVSKTEDFRLCAVCEAMAPPRSWHCNICQTCILKRDHHCTFVGCCIGHDNHRYFMTMLFYMAVSTIYASYFNILFFINTFGVSFGTLFRLVFPLASLLFAGNEFLIHSTFYFLIFNIIGMGISTVLLIMNTKLILKGRVAYENTKNIGKYDLGKKENIKLVFGERWYIAWLSPLIKSPLPHNGVFWETEETVKNK